MRSRLRKRLLLVPLVLEVAVLVACGDDGGPPTDAAVVDVAMVDAPIDAIDARIIDAIDAPPPDLD